MTKKLRIAATFLLLTTLILLYARPLPATSYSGDWEIGSAWTVGPAWILEGTSTYTITVRFTTGGSVQVNGTSYGNNTSANFTSGDTINFTAVASTYYSFGNFTYDATFTVSNPLYYIVNASDTVKAYFQIGTGTITFNNNDNGDFYVNGTLTANETATLYNQGTILQLSAVADANYTFSMWNWTGGNSTNNPYYYTVSGSNTVWALFGPLAYTITFYKNTNPDFFYANSTWMTNGTSVSYNYGDVLNLTALVIGADTTFSIFVWSTGNSTSNPTFYNVTGTDSVWAIFVPSTVIITNYIIIGSGNLVYVNGTLIANGTSTSYNPGTILILTAVPTVGYAFEYFSYAAGNSTLNPTTYTVPNYNDTIYAYFTATVPIPQNIVYYFRSDTHTVNSITGYNLQTSYGGTSTFVSQNLGSSGSIVEFGFMVYMVNSLNVSSSLSGSTPIAIIVRSGAGEGYQSATVYISDYPMNLGLDAIKVTLYIRLQGSSWLPSATFISDRLMYKGLNSATWNFTMYTKVAFSGLDTIAYAYWDSQPYAGGFAGPTFVSPLPQDLALYKAQTGDWIGAVFAPYMIFMGDLFYGFGLMFIGGTLYLRHKKWEVILVALLLFAGPAGVGFLIPNVAYRLLYIVVAFVIAFVLYRLFR